MWLRPQNSSTVLACRSIRFLRFTQTNYNTAFTLVRSAMNDLAAKVQAGTLTNATDLVPAIEKACENNEQDFVTVCRACGPALFFTQTPKGVSFARHYDHWCQFKKKAPLLFDDPVQMLDMLRVNPSEITLVGRDLMKDIAFVKQAWRIFDGNTDNKQAFFDQIDASKSSQIPLDENHHFWRSPHVSRVPNGHNHEEGYEAMKRAEKDDNIQSNIRTWHEKFATHTGGNRFCGTEFHEHGSKIFTPQVQQVLLDKLWHTVSKRFTLDFIAVGKHPVADDEIKFIATSIDDVMYGGHIYKLEPEAGNAGPENNDVIVNLGQHKDPTRPYRQELLVNKSDEEGFRKYDPMKEITWADASTEWLDENDPSKPWQGIVYYLLRMDSKKFNKGNKFHSFNAEQDEFVSLGFGPSLSFSSLGQVIGVLVHETMHHAFFARDSACTGWPMDDVYMNKSPNGGHTYPFRTVMHNLYNQNLPTTLDGGGFACIVRNAPPSQHMQTFGKGFEGGNLPPFLKDFGQNPDGKVSDVQEEFDTGDMVLFALCNRGYKGIGLHWPPISNSFRYLGTIIRAEKATDSSWVQWLNQCSRRPCVHLFKNHCLVKIENTTVHIDTTADALPKQATPAIDGARHARLIRTLFIGNE